jgi:hypothetical protein
VRPDSNSSATRSMWIVCQSGSRDLWHNCSQKRFGLIET